MNNTQLCRSLLSAIASTPCPITCGAAAIPTRGLALLWDNRPDAKWVVLAAIAAEFGEMVATASIDHGPRGQMMIGALVRPLVGSLEETAAAMRARYYCATQTGELLPTGVATPAAIPRPKIRPRRKAS